MIGTVHDEVGTRRQRTELPDLQPVADMLEVIANVPVLKIRGVLEIVVVGVVADLDRRPRYDVFQENRMRFAIEWMKGVG